MNDVKADRLADPAGTFWAFGRPLPPTPSRPRVPRSLFGRLTCGAASLAIILAFGALAVPAYLLGGLARIAWLGLSAGWRAGQDGYEMLVVSVDDPFCESVQAGDTVDFSVDDDHEL